MEISLNNYYKKRSEIFNRIQESSKFEKIVMVFLMAGLTGIAAQIIIPLPWTPVPITAQTFAVLISGLFLGKRLGSLSQVVYILIGILGGELLGFSWFGNMTGGLGVFLGSDCGYFIGFIIAAYFIGYLSEKYSKSRKLRNILPIMLTANFACIYIPGLIVLAIWANYNLGGYPDLISLLMMGLVPFIIGDLVKIIAASGVSKLFLPKN
ncbi:MAG: biotin transporter BioY [Methanobrevibacter sp.]|jgi:biotin transport system substrate-specific component|nr:biotin transporter BioY [Candidatus Methanoflexus mossambicus]